MAEWRLPLVERERYAFVEPDPDGVAHIAANLRPGDAEECHATFGHRRYEDGLRIAMAGAQSVVMAVTAYGEPIGLIGVNTVSLLNNKGSPWAVATSGADRFRSALITMGRTYTQAMLQEYERLENHVDARNLKSVAWLQHIGYTLEPAQPFGALGLPFHKFKIER